MPILGLLASAISGNLFALSGAYDSIATTTLATATSSITFSSIPATYTHLQIRGFARHNTTSDNTVIQLNGDTGSNYSLHYLVGTGGGSFTAGAEASAARTYIDILTTSATSFSGSVTDILDYANTSKYKTMKTLAGIELNGSGSIWFATGLWMNTAAVTSIVVKPGTGNFSANTQFALYGIKGA